MQLLAVAAALYGFHHNIFCCHKGQLFHHSAVNNLFIDHKVGGYIYVDIEYGIHCQKRFGNGNALVCAVVKRALKPLHACGHCGVYGVDYNISCKGGNAFAAHGIALIRHCG